ncbi:vanomycin resistance protein VanB [Amycolatopsis suaedae]|uniref:Vanomycin resistance protein VanB n=2 Tax=Amycolatopsis suaedae TaxID=2510978 RepID=A0A4Q7JF77_9PSEU|nr:vanomycin resistance protein VanB [Amycolatopsis suaedae]
MPTVLERPRTPATRFRRNLGKVFIGLGLFAVAFVIAYAVDLIATIGTVPRGVTVAGIDVGGMDREDAEAKLRTELEPRLTQPVRITAGDVVVHLDPVRSGLGLDWPRTLEQAGDPPFSPITRLLSFFTSREVGVVTVSDPNLLRQAVVDLAVQRINHGMTEGSIGFRPAAGDGAVEAYPIDPRQGQELTDIDGAVTLIRDNWLLSGGVTVPVSVTHPKATAAGVRAALDSLVAKAVAQPVIVQGDGRDAVLRPAEIAAGFRFRPLDDGRLEVLLDQNALQAGLAPQLAPTERQAKDAQITFPGDRPVVQPAEDGRRVAWVKTFEPFMRVIQQPGERRLVAVYEPQRPGVTTDAVNALGIREVVGEFTTSGFSGAMVANVHAMAGKVTGAIVRPGETFSLDQRTGPRSAANGFVAAPVHEDGTGPALIGGGVSQFTSTLYNAVYLAGLADAGHTEHDYYIDWFPPARDAKSLAEDGSTVDMLFTNDGPTGVAVQAVASGSSVTVRIWGTKRFRVESATGPQTDIVDPPVRVGGPGCQPSPGIPGFTVADTRIRYDLRTGAEAGRDTRTVTYRPRPHVLCP